MTFFKRVAFVFVLCAAFSPVNAVRYPYIPLPSDECPKGTVRVPYAALSKMNIPPDVSRLPGTRFLEITSEPVYRIVEVEFRPGHPLPVVTIPEDFPMDINEQVQPFMIHLHRGGSADRFPEIVGPAFSSITGGLEETITLDGRVVGKRIFHPLMTPLDFFKALESEIRRVQTKGFYALCRHNPGLMSVMGTILRKDGDLRNVEYANLLNLAQIFHNSGIGRLEKEERKFSLTMGRHRFMAKEQHDPKDLQPIMAEFLSQAFPRQILDNLFSSQSGGAGVFEGGSSSGDEQSSPQFTADQIKAATTIQRIFRGYMARTQFLEMRDAANTIARSFKGLQARKHLAKLKAEHQATAATTIQRLFRGHIARTQFLEMRDAANTIARSFKGLQARKHLAKLRAEQDHRIAAATTIQKLFRGHMARTQVFEMRNAAPESLNDFLENADEGIDLVDGLVDGQPVRHAVHDPAASADDEGINLDALNAGAGLDMQGDVSRDPGEAAAGGASSSSSHHPLSAFDDGEARSSQARGRTPRTQGQQTAAAAAQSSAQESLAAVIAEFTASPKDKKSDEKGRGCIAL